VIFKKYFENSGFIAATLYKRILFDGGEGKLQHASTVHINVFYSWLMAHLPLVDVVLN
jgi:hypothetical protein